MFMGFIWVLIAIAITGLLYTLVAEARSPRARLGVRVQQPAPGRRREQRVPRVRRASAGLVQPLRVAVLHSTVPDSRARIPHIHLRHRTRVQRVGPGEQSAGLGTVRVTGPRFPADAGVRQIGPLLLLNPS